MSNGKLSPNDAYRWYCPGCKTVNSITFNICCACGSYKRPSIGIESMSAAGFVWDPARGYPRWTHCTYGITALRSPWMTQENWEDHMAKKIDEANQNDQIPGKPYLQENKQDPGRYHIVRNRGTLIEYWNGEDWDSGDAMTFIL